MKPLIGIATPIGSTCSTEYVRSLTKTFACPQEFPDFVLARLDCVGSLIAHNRNVLCADALAMQCDVLLEVDSDMAWGFEDIRALVRPILAGKAQIVAAPCSPRVIDWDYLRAAVLRGDDPQRHAGPAHMELLPEDAEKRRLRGFRFQGHTYVRMARMGLGMCAIGRQTLSRLFEASPKYEYHHERTLSDLHPQGAAVTHYQSEDLGFFKLAGGVPVYACATADVGHESGGNVFRQAWLNDMLRNGWSFDDA